MSKIYHTETQEDFNALMKELEEKGYVWFGGNKPTQRLDFWKFLSKEMCIQVDNNKSLTFCDSNYYQSRGFEIIEYRDPKKEEQK
ncbi:hypothetical protein ACFFIF_01835 [Vagococcus entomophilus]|uniref:Uncharacterized protein n=1 Tax=Vagococcus entomophilus TaxID=1160095 RepID=A0A430AK61_9ENTE|nr:hypothetical protein [Vagococcus entomophilus]RSU08458.1 hypothetical protein CBF30_04250 [Vagococcus entomophilus]